MRSAGVPPFRSPKADFSAPGSMLPGTPQSLSSTEPAPRNGLSLARNGCPLSEASIPGSKVPACYFATSSSFPRPVRLLLPCLRWFAPVDRQLLRFRPVAALLAGSLGCFLCLHSPPGLLPPSGSKRSTDSAASAARLPNSPDFLSLPAAGSISRVGCGSPFLARYVSGGLLFLKPLGTFFTMPLTPCFVNAFRALTHMISSIFIWFVSKRLHRIAVEFAVHKTDWRGYVAVPVTPSRDKPKSGSSAPTWPGTDFAAGSFQLRRRSPFW